jgi:hypothetical protein
MPQCASEIIGNWSASKKLRDWLMQWKERIARFAEKSSTQKSSSHQQKTTCNNTSKCVHKGKAYSYFVKHPRIYVQNNVKSQFILTVAVR